MPPRINRPLRSRRVALVFQDDLLFPHLDVAANLRFGLNGWPRGEITRRVSEIAMLCGVDHLLTRWPVTLSGGERQRVGLARALAPRPKLLLCDEPVSALDLDARYELLDRLEQVRAAEAIPALYVTHSPAEALTVGSRLFLLEAGRIMASGPPLDVLSDAEAARWRACGTCFGESLRVRPTARRACGWAKGSRCLCRVSTARKRRRWSCRCWRKKYYWRSARWPD